MKLTPKQKLIRDAKLIRRLLELGDQRLLASDGPVAGKLPDLSPEEWGRIYAACFRIIRVALYPARAARRLRND